MSYKPLLDLRETEKAIRLIKEFFQINLAKELNLFRVSAPLFVWGDTGINDNLNGIEKPVSFSVKDVPNRQAECVQSLAKWKRMALGDYGFKPGEGLYTDMNAIRPDETLDEIHSVYVDQWDWERVLTAQDRNLDFLYTIVRKIYGVIKKTEEYVSEEYPVIKPVLPPTIEFLHTEELEKRFPNLSPRERENEVAKEFGAVFVIGIGAPLASGEIHDGRAPDYDDWSTPTPRGKGLNGDIVVWNPVLQRAYELSSMGIRVDAEAMKRQLSIRKSEERTKFLFHRRVLADEIPLSIGGGIGQSRLCMFYLRKAHVGEVQVGVWPGEMLESLKKKNIILL